MSSVTTREIVAVEIVRALVGSVGLIASVPISTALAATILGSTLPVDDATSNELRSGDRTDPNITGPHRAE
jgi:hypothetical protein